MPNNLHSKARFIPSEELQDSQVRVWRFGDVALGGFGEGALPPGHSRQGGFHPLTPSQEGTPDALPVAEPHPEEEEDTEEVPSAPAPAPEPAPPAMDEEQLQQMLQQAHQDGFAQGHQQGVEQASQEWQQRLQEQSRHMYGDNPMMSAETWGQFLKFQAPAIQGLMSSYLEQSTNMFVEMQQQLNKQTRSLFSSFPFTGFPSDNTNPFGVWNAPPTLQDPDKKK